MSETASSRSDEITKSGQCSCGTPLVTDNKIVVPVDDVSDTNCVATCDHCGLKYKMNYNRGGKEVTMIIPI